MKRKNEQTDSMSLDANAPSTSSGQANRPEDVSPGIITGENHLPTHPLDTASQGIARDAQHAPAESSTAHPEQPAICTDQLSSDASGSAAKGAADIIPSIVLPLSPFGPEEWESVELPPVALHVAGSKYSVRFTIRIKEEAIDAADVPSGRRLSAPEVKNRKQKTTAEQSRATDGPRIHVRIRRAAFEKLRSTVGSHPPERGGIFVGSDPFLLEDFIFDRTSNPAGAVYYPNTKYLNDVLARDHEPYGRYFVGLAHSHPAGMWHPSGDESWGDIKAARNNLLAADNAHLPALFIPIIESTAATGAFAMHAFVMMRDDMTVHPADYEIIDGGDAC